MFLGRKKASHLGNPKSLFLVFLLEVMSSSHLKLHNLAAYTVSYEKNAAKDNQFGRPHPVARVATNNPVKIDRFIYRR